MSRFQLIVTSHNKNKENSHAVLVVVVIKEQPAVESQRGLRSCLAPDQPCDLLLDFSEPRFAHL